MSSNGRTGRHTGRGPGSGRTGRGRNGSRGTNMNSPQSIANRNNNSITNTANSGGSRKNSTNRNDRGGRNTGRGRGGRNNKVDLSKMSPAERFKYLESKMNKEVRIKRELAATIIQKMAKTLMERLKLLKSLEVKLRIQYKHCMNIKDERDFAPFSR